MIINKKTKSILTRSDIPNENWTNEPCYVVDDKSALATKILTNYPNVDYVIENGQIIDVNIIEFVSQPLTHDEINAKIINKIRERYSINEEFKIINLGILDSANTDYIAYRNYVAECIAWGDALESTKAGD